MTQGSTQILYDLDSFKDLMRLPTVDQADWDNIWNQFKTKFHYDSLVGPPYLAIESLLDGVKGEAAELYSIGQRTSDLGKLLNLALLETTGSVPKTYLTSAVDLGASGGPVDLSLSRAYDGSLLTRDRAGFFGDGWTFNFDISAVTDSAGDVVISAPGDPRLFKLQANGTYTPDAGTTGSLALVSGAYVLTEADGKIVDFRADGRLASITDANGNVVTTAWSAGNQLTSVSSSTGQLLTFTYTAQGRIASATDSVGRTTTYTYDASGTHLLTATTAEGITTYTYQASTGSTADNALTSIAYQDGSHHFFTYDGNGRLSSEYDDGNAGKVSYGYATPGEVVESDAFGHPTTLLYNASGEIARVVDANNHTINLSYDDNGFLSEVVTAGGSVATYVNDPLGNVTGYTDPLGGSISAPTTRRDTSRR